MTAQHAKALETALKLERRKCEREARQITRVPLSVVSLPTRSTLFPIAFVLISSFDSRAAPAAIFQERDNLQEEVEDLRRQLEAARASAASSSSGGGGGASLGSGLGGGGGDGEIDFAAELAALEATL